jgi:hypothetical protein
MAARASHGHRGCLARSGGAKEGGRLRTQRIDAGAARSVREDTGRSAALGAERSDSGAENRSSQAGEKIIGADPRRRCRGSSSRRASSRAGQGAQPRELSRASGARRREGSLPDGRPLQGSVSVKRVEPGRGLSGARTMKV